MPAQQFLDMNLTTARIFVRWEPARHNISTSIGPSGGGGGGDTISREDKQNFFFCNILCAHRFLAKKKKKATRVCLERVELYRVHRG
jgi:hypothetical protein